MLDLLILTPDNGLNQVLQKFGEAHGYRVRTCVHTQKAGDWLAVRDFDVAIVHASIPLEQQQQLASKLWERNLAALLYVFSFEAKNSPEMRLFGAEVIQGAEALNLIESMLRRHAGAFVRNNPSDFRVLVVEDLASPRDIICIFVESLGYPSVTPADSALEALKLLHSEPRGFSCILTDVRMPYMSGQQLIESVRADERYNGLPIIVLTAFGTADCLLDCLRAGASGFLAKPPKKADLQRELGRAQRIFSQKLDPRLVKEEEFEQIREMLQTKGYL